MRSFIDQIKDIHKGQDVYIVGKGLSLKNLNKSYIWAGVIITINDAIEKVESLNFSNPTYSMQKDGMGGEQNQSTNEPLHDCSLHGTMPKKATLLVHKYGSSNCMLDYKPRLVFDNLELGLQICDFSALSCIKIAQVMGCKRFFFVSFDACTRGDGRSALNNVSYPNYFAQCERMKPYLSGLNYKFITPNGAY